MIWRQVNLHHYKPGIESVHAAICSGKLIFTYRKLNLYCCKLLLNHFRLT